MGDLLWESTRLLFDRNRLDDYDYNIERLFAIKLIQLRTVFIPLRRYSNEMRVVTLRDHNWAQL
jgi:hypothetical protein